MEDFLREALKYGMLKKEDLECLEHNIEMKKREEILNQHPYSIWQGKTNGSWYTKLPDDTKVNPRTIKRKNKIDIENIIIDFWREKTENPTIRELFKQWIEERKTYGELRKSSVKKYENDYIRFIKNTDFERIHIRSLSEEQLYSFIKETIIEKELTAKAFSGLRIILKGILKYAKRMKYTTISASTFFEDLDLGKNIFKKTKKEPKAERFTDDEARKIMDYISDNLTIRNLAIKLCFQTGVRVGELAALKPEDINYQEKTIHIQRTEITYKDDNGKSVVEVSNYPKTDESDRYIIITDSCIDTIRRVRSMNMKGEYLFQEKKKRIRSNALRRALYRICDKVSIPRRGPHCIRRTYASTLLDNHTDESLVKNQMGHTDITTTIKYYQFCVRNNSEQREQILNAINY